MLRLIPLFALFFCVYCFSEDRWRCVESSTEVRDDGVVAACGIGEGPSESVARSMALLNAKNEFSAVCSEDTLCGMHKYAVDPKRASCTVIDGSWKCYRMVVFRAVEELKREIASTTTIPSQSVDTVKLSNQELIDRALRQGMGGR